MYLAQSHMGPADLIHKNMSVAKHIGVTQAVMKLCLCLADPQGCTTCFGHVLAEKQAITLCRISKIGAGPLPWWVWAASQQRTSLVDLLPELPG